MSVVCGVWQPGVTELLTLDSALCQRLRRIALQPQAATTEMCVRVGSPGDHLVLGSLLHVEYFHGARLPQVSSPVNLSPRACGSCARQSTHMTILFFTGLLLFLPCNDREQNPCVAERAEALSASAWGHRKATRSPPFFRAKIFRNVSNPTLTLETESAASCQRTSNVVDADTIDLPRCRPCMPHRCNK